MKITYSLTIIDLLFFTLNLFLYKYTFNGFNLFLAIVFAFDGLCTIYSYKTDQEIIDSINNKGPF